MKRRELFIGLGFALATLLVLFCLSQFLHWNDPQWAERLANGFVERRFPALPDTRGARAPSPEAYNAAAALLNFQYGVPVATLGVLFGFLATLVAAYVGNLVASRQGDVQILEFVEKRIRPAVEHQRALTAAIDDLLFCGVRGRNLVIDAIELFEAEQGQGPMNVLARVNRKAPVLPVAARDDDPRAEIEERARRFLVDLDAANDRLQEAFANISGDLYSSMFCTRQIARAAATAQPCPLAYLRSIAPRLAAAAPHIFGESVPELAESIGRFTAATEAEELIKSFLILPHGHNEVDYIGATLLLHTVLPPMLHEHRGRRIGAYHLNIGAAYILATAQCLPDKAVIEEVFNEIFANRSRVAHNFIRTTIPSREALGLPRTFQSIDTSLKALNRLVIVEVQVGDPTSTEFRSEFYDPAVHDAIPAEVFNILMRAFAPVAAA